MNEHKDYIIILLRKVFALFKPDSFDATEDTSKEIIMEKLELINIFLFDVVKDFLSSFEAAILLEQEQSTNNKNESNIVMSELKNNIKILQEECKSYHINIDYELEQLLNNGNIIEE